jgi:hypothetical protein
VLSWTLCVQHSASFICTGSAVRQLRPPLLDPGTGYTWPGRGAPYSVLPYSYCVSLPIPDGLMVDAFLSNKLINLFLLRCRKIRAMLSWIQVCYECAWGLARSVICSLVLQSLSSQEFCTCVKFYQHFYTRVIVITIALHMRNFYHNIPAHASPLSKESPHMRDRYDTKIPAHA